LGCAALFLLQKVGQAFMSFLAWIVLGLFAGFISSKIVNKRGEGVILDILLGSSAQSLEAGSLVHSVPQVLASALINIKPAQ
jgi:uncharacterized membrane protein YeaQ/YmgE (transglycosylase-associated protein family)